MVLYLHLGPVIRIKKNINKDVLWFFIKLVLQTITKTHDNVCCACLYSKIQPVTGKTITWLKEHYTSIKMHKKFKKYIISVKYICIILPSIGLGGELPHPLCFAISSKHDLRSI